MPITAAGRAKVPHDTTLWGSRENRTCCTCRASNPAIFTHAVAHGTPSDYTLGRSELHPRQPAPKGTVVARIREGFVKGRVGSQDSAFKANRDRKMRLPHQLMTVVRAFENDTSKR